MQPVPYGCFVGLCRLFSPPISWVQLVIFSTLRHFGRDCNLHTLGIWLPFVMAGMKLKPGGDARIDVVQIEGVALMKIIKHCHHDVSGFSEEAQGVLLGLPMDNKLEVTNCFAFPRNPDGVDDERYQLEMMRLLRLINVDYLSVGWYQSALNGNHVSRQLLESQQQYQESIDESFVLMYDPQKTASGFLSLRAYRLSPRAMQLVKAAGYFDFEMLKNLKISHETLFHELKVVIRNSHLVNALLSELSEEFPESLNIEQMDLASAPVLERYQRCMMDCTDEMSQVHQYQKMVAKQQVEKQRYLLRRNQENTQRKLRGEPPLPEDDGQQFRPLPPPRDVEPGLVVAGQMSTYCQQINSFTAQSLAKLFLVDSIRQQPRPAGQ